MTRTVDAENEQKRKLGLQRVAVEYNGQSDILRPEAIHVRGVENLSTNDIKRYVDYYVNYTRVDDGFELITDKKDFRVQWIDDSNVNLVFKTHETAVFALQALAEQPMQIDLNIDNNDQMNVEDTNQLEGSDDSQRKPTFSPEYVAELLVERVARLYAPSIDLKKFTNQQKLAKSEELFETKKSEKDAMEVEKLEEEGSSVVLYVRQAVQSDRKVENASAYSRYYLLHGEPDRSRKPRRRGETRGQFQREKTTNEEDLFLDKLSTYKENKAREDIEEDLFADRLREVSPSRRRR